ncbi:Glycerol kinase [Batrachochytrium dendrobatidis]
MLTLINKQLGSIAIAGAAVKWLRDNLGIISEASQVSEFAAKVPDTAGIYFIPAFSGLFAPYWRDDVRGCIVGMTQYTNKYHICRAALEATAFQTREILDAMNSDSGQAIQLLRVDGGLTNSDICMQIQADIAGVGVDRPLMRETTALGAALAAGLAVGVWKSLDDFSHVNQSDIFKPATSSSDREERLAGWKKAVQRLF